MELRLISKDESLDDSKKGGNDDLRLNNGDLRLMEGNYDLVDGVKSFERLMGGNGYDLKVVLSRLAT